MNMMLRFPSGKIHKSFVCHIWLSIHRDIRTCAHLFGVRTKKSTYCGNKWVFFPRVRVRYSTRNDCFSTWTVSSNVFIYCLRELWVIYNYSISRSSRRQATEYCHVAIKTRAQRKWNSTCMTNSMRCIWFVLLINAHRHVLLVVLLLYTEWSSSEYTGGAFQFIYCMLYSFLTF